MTTSIVPGVITAFGPYLSNKRPIVGANTQLSKLPGKRIRPVVNAAITKAICIYIGKITSMDNIL
ncbi:hypothetical protein D3C72_2153430 [compost metagenome]